MSKPKTPKVPQYNPADIIAADARANRTNLSTPFGQANWSNNGGQWSQDIQLSPEMQQVLNRVFSQAGQGMGEFSSGGIQGTAYQRPAEDMGNHMVGRKQQMQNMDYRPPQGQGMARGGQFFGGAPLAQGRFAPSSTLSSPNNEQSARDAAALYQDLIPKPPEFDPMRYRNAYRDLFGSTLFNG